LQGKFKEKSEKLKKVRVEIAGLEAEKEGLKLSKEQIKERIDVLEQKKATLSETLKQANNNVISLKDEEKNLSSNLSSNLTKYKTNMKHISVIKMDNVSNHYKNCQAEIDRDKIKRDLSHKQSLLSQNKEQFQLLQENGKNFADVIKNCNEQYQTVKSDNYGKRKEELQEKLKQINIQNQNIINRNAVKIK